MNDAITQNKLENGEVEDKHQFTRARQHNLEEGDLVYKCDFAHIIGISNTLWPKLSGPFKIKFLVGRNNAKLRNIITGQNEEVLVILDRLKMAR